MGVSNSEMLISEKDLNSMEFNFLVRPSLEFEEKCEIASSQDCINDDGNDLELNPKEREQEQEKEEEEEKDRKCKLLVSALKIELPSLEEVKINQDDDDGFKTPTSLDQKIPIILPCPPAPRKPKSLPTNKRKSLAPPGRRVLLDLSNEIESLFPPSLRADLGGKIKKTRQENEFKVTS
ncbi:hypothetical protein JCGZ_05695 [Jatropha curcas]|uniref:Cyclin-dependent protein kinase inhibitor SMR3-like n=2 Tax=Jatropha curcas TaxID=180498 RepID=A0A067LAL5_JATCU|nr:hypothetical protein JCGZ_05695 [Jatropha curcas]